MSIPASPHATEKTWRDADAAGQPREPSRAIPDLPLPLVRVLASRGLTDAEAVDRFLHPRLSELTDPFLLPDMYGAVERIWRAIDHEETIVVFGDYDVDGVTSTALAVRVLRQLGARVTPFLPHRVDDGYGLSIEALEKCMAAHHPKLILTVDCGTGSVEAVEAAGGQGVDVIVTDHHELGGAMASALAVVNPKRSEAGEASPLAGVGVTFKLCHALVKAGRDSGHDGCRGIDLRESLDFVALGTIADVVPLVGENRILARRGLECLDTTSVPGLRALKEVAGVTELLRAYHVGFILGPRLNAAGRLAGAERALELLLTDEPSTALTLARELDRMNVERQEVEKAILEEALAQTDDVFDPSLHHAVVADGEAWHPGVVGIVAARLCERYYRPTVVIAHEGEGVGRGSGRSIEGFNLVEALEDCSEHLVKFGGHAMAAGLEIDVDRIESFRDAFERVAAERLAGHTLCPVQRIDTWLTLREADERLFEAIEMMRPFGHGNPTPVWAAREVQVVGSPRVVGEKHLKMMVASGGSQFDCIGFNLGHRQVPDGPIDIAFQLKKNRFRGRESLELSLQDFRPSQG